MKDLNANNFDDPVYRAVAKAECENSHLTFTRYFFKARQNQSFLVNWHHHFIADIVDDVIAGRRRNIVINLSPGGTKTELVVINFIARGLALNPWARFLHLSGSDMLASLNSSTAREIVQTDEFQKLWPMAVADDSNSKKRWNVMVGDTKAGGVYATSIGGQVTGFRAGHMTEGFSGAILIDDPIKPEDIYSKPKTEQANRKLITTVKSRKANPQTPVVLIMQRVGANDPTHFIEQGALGDFEIIRIPAIIDEEALKEIPEKYHAMMDRSETDDLGRFSYWPYKEPLQELVKMERGEGIDAEGQRVSKYVYASQYGQKPKVLGGNIIKGDNFVRYQVLPQIKWRKVYADTAQKTNERNDRSVFEEWGLGIDGRIYLLNLIKDRWEAPELQRRAIAFWSAAKARDVEKFGQCRAMPIEDKSSGTGLIQTLKLPPHNIPVEPIERVRDKLTRVMDVLSYIEASQVCIPEAASYTLDFVQECEAFTNDDTHDFDDQIDPMVDAINEMLQAGSLIKTWEELGKSTQRGGENESKASQGKEPFGQFNPALRRRILNSRLR
jgi:predicted phage terminase large subunit-like protein